MDDFFAFLIVMVMGVLIWGALVAVAAAMAIIALIVAVLAGIGAFVGWVLQRKARDSNPDSDDAAVPR